MLRNIDDISSIFCVSGYHDTIFAKENRFLEKLEKITKYRRYIGKLPIYQTQKCRLVKKLKNTHKLTDILAFIVDISPIYRR